MINLSLPLRPRTGVRCEYLLTPISIVSEIEGKKILCLSDIKSAGNPTQINEYLETISLKLGGFDRIMKDSNPEFLNSALALISKTLSPYRQEMPILTCECGAYEEIENARRFDLRRVVDNVCEYCGTITQSQKLNVLLSDINWPLESDFVCNRTWSRSDLINFLKRQTKTHKISKRVECTKIQCSGIEFGIRYQIIWAAMIAYLAELENDNDVTMHYVQKVQDKVFFVCSLAKLMRPKINFYLKALPIVWLDDAPNISNCSNSHIKLLTKSLTTKRKDLRVSLKSWRCQ